MLRLAKLGFAIILLKKRCFRFSIKALARPVYRSKTCFRLGGIEFQAGAKDAHTRIMNYGLAQQERQAKSKRVAFCLQRFFVWRLTGIITVCLASDGLERIHKLNHA